jgi:hypothetical protein
VKPLNILAAVTYTALAFALLKCCSACGEPTTITVCDDAAIDEYVDWCFHSTDASLRVCEDFATKAWCHEEKVLP